MEVGMFFAGLAIGAIIVNVFYLLQATDGVLRIDHTNPDKDIYRIEIDDIELLSEKARVKLRVDNNADFSQK